MAKTKTPVLQSIIVEQITIVSDYLEREVIVDAYLPKNILLPEQLPLLLINDGQDLVKIHFDEMLDEAIGNGDIQPLMCIGIHCGEDRKLEYGVAHRQDYKGRGSRAGQYNKFVFDELLPYIRRQYNISNFKEKAFAGFSLGGLTALDIAWNYASEFTKVGVFSGSLWWRRKAYDDGYDDETDRIMHLQVRKGTFRPWLKFFFQCGTEDEAEDRNKNGVIDSIDDTLDLIVELKAKGYTDEHICYYEMDGGKHDVKTWGEALPGFLKWGWGRGNEK
jgi:enterochelin esterase-like enzyme